MTQNKSHKSLQWSNIRWLTALMGFLLLIFGQFQVAGSAIQVTASIPLGDWLTNTIHLGVPDIDNVLLGLPILLFGGILLAVSLRGLSLLPMQSEETTAEIPIAIRKIRSAWPGILAGLVIFTILLLQLGRLKYDSLSPIIWIITLLIFAITAALWDRRREVDLSPGISRKDLLWLIGLLAVGLIIGTYRLQGWPDQLMGDEGNFWTAARDIATGTFRPSIFGIGVYSFPVMSSFLQAWVMKLFGVNLWGWRFGSVLPGVITVVPLYLLARDAFNRKVAVVSSIVLITSPYFLAFSRLGYNNIQALFITVLALYWLYNGLNRNSSLSNLSCGLCGRVGVLYFFWSPGDSGYRHSLHNCHMADKKNKISTSFTCSYHAGSRRDSRCGSIFCIRYPSRRPIHGIQNL